MVRDDRDGVWFGFFFIKFLLWGFGYYKIEEFIGLGFLKLER